MGSIMADITGYGSVNSANRANPMVQQSASDGFDLNMQDFLNLMVTELKSQSIDNTADTSEMLNQMVMMQMVSALTNMTDASIMGYAASLVGKTITVGGTDSNGNVQEIVGTVTATGTMGGQQVVFVNDKYYYMNQIMAVGKLPDQPKPEDVKPEDVKPEETVPEAQAPETVPETQQPAEVEGTPAG